MKERAPLKKRPVSSGQKEELENKNESVDEELNENQIKPSLSLDEQYELYRQRYIQSHQQDVEDSSETKLNDGEPDISSGDVSDENESYLEDDLFSEDEPPMDVWYDGDDEAYGYSEEDALYDDGDGEYLKENYYETEEDDYIDPSFEYDDGFDQYETSFEEDYEDEYMPGQEKKRKRKEKDFSYVISTGGWFGIIFLLLIPVFNILLLLVWSFASRNETKKNFCRATLLWILILAITAAVFATVFATAIGNILGGIPGDILS